MSKQKWAATITFKEIFGVDEVKIPLTVERLEDVIDRGSIPLELMYESIKTYVEEYPEESEKYSQVLAYLERMFQTRRTEDDALEHEYQYRGGSTR